MYVVGLVIAKLLATSNAPQINTISDFRRSALESGGALKMVCEEGFATHDFLKGTKEYLEEESFRESIEPR